MMAEAFASFFRISKGSNSNSSMLTKPDVAGSSPAVCHENGDVAQLVRAQYKMESCQVFRDCSKEHGSGDLEATTDNMHRHGAKAVSSMGKMCCRGSHIEAVDVEATIRLTNERRTANT